MLWKTWEKKGVGVAFIGAIQDLYEGVTTSVKTLGRKTKDFPTGIGLHEGSTFSSCLIWSMMCLAGTYTRLSIIACSLRMI